MAGHCALCVRAQPCAADVDSFFNFCYHYLAEHLAEGLAPHETGEASDIEDDTLECTEHEILRDNPAAVAAQENLPQRWLPPMKLSELYDNYEFLYQAETVSSHPAASRSVFYKIFKSRWRGVLRFRKHSQHSKCDHCVRYQMGRQKATTETECKQVQEAYRAHLGQVFRDRDLAAHYARHSELSNAPGSTIPASQRTLYIQLDGMDQAKLRGRQLKNLGKPLEARAAQRGRHLPRCGGVLLPDGPGPAQRLQLSMHSSVQSIGTLRTGTAKQGSHPSGTCIDPPGQYMSRGEESMGQSVGSSSGHSSRPE